MRKKILTRILYFLRIKVSDLCDDDFDIILDRERKDLVGPGNLVVCSSKPGAASVTWEGAIRLFSSSYWIRMSLKDLITLLNHEIMHIVIGQNQGMIVSEKYDNLAGNRIAVSSSSYTSDLFRRVEGI